MFVVFIVARTLAPSCHRDESISFFNGRVGGGPREDPTTHWPIVLCNCIISIVLNMLSLRLSNDPAIVRVVGTLAPMVLLWWHVTEYGAMN